MKTLLVAARKGGTGKSAISTQFSYYLSEIKKKRTLFIDLDDHLSTTILMKAGGVAEILDYTSLDVFSGRFKKEPHQLKDGKMIAFLPSVSDIRDVIEQPNYFNEFVSMFLAFTKLNSTQFDYCVIDTSPNSDIRLYAAYLASDFVLSPVDVMQEAIDTLPELLKEINLFGEDKRKEADEDLKFIGFLPNRFDQTSPLEKKNYIELVRAYHTDMIKISRNQYATVNKRSIIAEAQSEGVPFWSIKDENGRVKTMARSTLNEIVPVFEAIFRLINS